LFFHDLEVTAHRAAKHKPKKIKVQREHYVKWQGYTLHCAMSLASSKVRLAQETVPA
jgi:hypothetical protein